MLDIFSYGTIETRDISIYLDFRNIHRKRELGIQRNPHHRSSKQNQDEDFI
jgi:hypothetical protein